MKAFFLLFLMLLCRWHSSYSLLVPSRTAAISALSSSSAARKPTNPQYTSTLTIRHHQQKYANSLSTTRYKTELSSMLPTLPWIGAADTWGNVAALTGTATIAQVIGTTTRIGRLLGPPVTAMALTFGLASIGILNPGGTIAAKSLQLLSLQLATPLILLGADLRDCVQRCGPLLLSFAAASMATVLGKLVLPLLFCCGLFRIKVFDLLLI